MGRNDRKFDGKPSRGCLPIRFAISSWQIYFILRLLKIECSGQSYLNFWQKCLIVVRPHVWQLFARHPCLRLPWKFVINWQCSFLKLRELVRQQFGCFLSFRNAKNIGHQLSCLPRDSWKILALLCLVTTVFFLFPAGWKARIQFEDCSLRALLRWCRAVAGSAALRQQENRLWWNWWSYCGSERRLLLAY